MWDPSFVKTCVLSVFYLIKKGKKLVLDLVVRFYVKNASFFPYSLDRDTRMSTSSHPLSRSPRQQNSVRFVIENSSSPNNVICYYDDSWLRFKQIKRYTMITEPRGIILDFSPRARVGSWRPHISYVSKDIKSIHYVHLYATNLYTANVRFIETIGYLSRCGFSLSQIETIFFKDWWKSLKGSHNIFKNFSYFKFMKISEKKNLSFFRFYKFFFENYKSKF